MLQLYYVYCNNHSQVLSESVSKALEYSKDEQVTEMAEFVSMMDKLFDCFNIMDKLFDCFNIAT